jgi:phosphoenolpyruvate---glycerone phosphotransferase subunit DhaL
MKENTIALDDLKEILKQVAVDMKEHVEELRELDATAGDGDLGITVELASSAMQTFLEAASADNIGELLSKCGMSINKISPSTFGTLLAAGFLGVAKAIGNKQEITIDDFMLMGDGAVAGIKNRGKAEVGDKTMLDSLVPAVEAFRSSLQNKIGLDQALNAAVKASETGMWATVKMKAKHGRSSRHKEGNVEIRDAGATAVYHIIESFCGHLKAIRT